MDTNNKSLSQPLTDRFWFNDVSLAAQKSLLKTTLTSSFRRRLPSPDDPKNYAILQRKNRQKLQNIESLDLLKKKRLGGSAENNLSFLTRPTILNVSNEVKSLFLGSQEKHHQKSLNSRLFRTVVLKKLGKRFSLERIDESSREKLKKQSGFLKETKNMMGKTINVFENLKSHHRSIYNEINVQSISKEALEMKYLDRIKKEFKHPDEEDERMNPISKEEQKRKEIEDSVAGFKEELKLIKGKIQEQKKIEMTKREALFRIELRIAQIYQQKRVVVEHYQKLEENAKEESLARGSMFLKKAAMASKKNVLIEVFMRAQLQKNEKGKKIAEIQESLRIEQEIQENIKRELEKAEKDIKDSLGKKRHLTNCLKNFYLSALNEEEVFKLLDMDLWKIILSLWKLKHKVEFCDMPSILDQKSRVYLLEYSHLHSEFEKMKKKALGQKKIGDGGSNKSASAISRKAASVQDGRDKNGIEMIRSLQKSFKNFESSLDKKCKSFHQKEKNIEPVKDFEDKNEIELTELVRRMNDMKNLEKQRIFDENMKKKLNYSDLEALKIYFRYIFGKAAFSHYFIEFISEKRVFDQKLKKNQTFNFKKSLQSSNGGGLLDSELMYKDIVREQKQKKHGNSKMKDVINDEKKYEEAFDWKNSFCKIMDVSI